MPGEGQRDKEPLPVEGHRDQEPVPVECQRDQDSVPAESQPDHEFVPVKSQGDEDPFEDEGFFDEVFRQCSARLTLIQRAVKDFRENEFDYATFRRHLCLKMGFRPPSKCEPCF